MYTIDSTLVKTIRAYRKRLDVDAQAAEIEDLSNQQPELVALVSAELKPLGEEVHWLGLNLIATVWRIFESAADDPVPRLTAGALAARFGFACRQLEALEDTSRPFVDRIVNVRYSRQPHVIAFLERQCLVYGRKPLETPLSEDAFAMLLTLISMTVDLMHFHGDEPEGQPQPAVTRLHA